MSWIISSGKSASNFSVEGVGRRNLRQSKSRLGLTMLMVSLAYVIVISRLAYLGFAGEVETQTYVATDIAITATRPDIRDRNGETLATDIVTSSLYAEPKRIIDADEAVEKLATVLPELNMKSVHRQLTSNAGFVWLKRELTPATENNIMSLGIPGIGFRTETRRFYPKGETASHIVGHVNIDNVGMAGLESYIDKRGLAELRKLGLASSRELEPVYLSVDLRVQHYVRDELAKAIKRYNAIAAGAIILDVKTGEIVAMSSLPDFDPNRPGATLNDDTLNRISGGLFEMGSTFKTFTTAMALDSGKVTMNDKFDATRPLRIGRHTINDFHAKRRVLSVPEVFIYSSNIGTAKMADVVGVTEHRNFLHRIGLLSSIDFELPEMAKPVEPKKWRKIHSVTVSYGHGAQTTPLQTAVAAAALVNGGKWIAPTLFPRTQSQAEEIAQQVIQPQTSLQMRQLLRLNVERGSGRRAEVEGFRVGGKTGTAEKVVNGRYSSDKRFNAFLAAFPIDKPEYVVLAFIDEPKPEEGKRSATAGLNAAPVVGNIIRRSAPVLGVHPDFGEFKGPLLISN